MLLYTFLEKKESYETREFHIFWSKHKKLLRSGIPFDQLTTEFFGHTKFSMFSNNWEKELSRFKRYKEKYKEIYNKEWRPYC